MAQTIKITQAQFAQLKNALQAEAALKFPRCKKYCNLKDYQDISPIHFFDLRLKCVLYR